jgi:very-short-patch-repair endonuclease
MGDTRKIDRLASRQHGVFSGSQARGAGFDKHAVARKLASGDWRQLDYRVFALASASPTWERQLWVALLSRPQAVVGGRAAAYLHRFDGFPRTKPVIIVPGSSNARSQIARVIRAEHYDELEVVRVRGFPVTSVAETLLTLAGQFAPSAFERVVDDVVLSGKVEVGQLSRVVDRDEGRRRRGIVLLRDMVSDRLPDAPSHDSSYLERMLERLLAKAALPPWSREHPFSINGRACRADVFIAAWRLVIEADGRNWHARVDAFEEDRRRDNELATRGIQVVRLTYRMLKSDPQGCLETIRAVGRVRSA